MRPRQEDNRQCFLETAWPGHSSRGSSLTPLDHNWAEENDMCTRMCWSSQHVPCSLQVPVENVGFLPEERRDQRLCKAPGMQTKQAHHYVATACWDKTGCQGQSSEPGGPQETDVSCGFSASDSLDDLSQTSDHLAPGLSFPLCKMRPLGPSPDDL